MAKNDMCIGQDLRKYILEKTPYNKDIVNLLDKVPDCGKNTKRAKRPPSEYNKFVSSCMKKIGKSVPVTERMKSCAVEWKKHKK